MKKNSHGIRPLWGEGLPPLAANEGGGEAKTLKNSVLREEMHSFRVFIAY